MALALDPLRNKAFEIVEQAYRDGTLDSLTSGQVRQKLTEAGLEVCCTRQAIWKWMRQFRAELETAEKKA
jgi:hypothetical protein